MWRHTIQVGRTSNLHPRTNPSTKVAGETDPSNSDLWCFLLKTSFRSQEQATTKMENEHLVLAMETFVEKIVEEKP